ncbi:hypothetical protein [Ruminococcus sp.]
MQLKITTDIRYMDPIKKSFGNDTSTYFSEAVYILTSNYYEQQSSFFFNKCTYMKCAKYIMEYLFLEFGVIVCNEGYSIKDMSDTGVQRNILDIKKEYMQDILIIKEIVTKIGYGNKDDIEISTEEPLGDHFLSWAKKTSLDAKVKIVILLNSFKLPKYNQCKDLSVFLNADKNNVDQYIEKFDEDITKLTPKFEFCRYRNQILSYMPIEKGYEKYPTAIHLIRDNNGKVFMTRDEFTNYPTISYMRCKILTRIEIKGYLESVTLIYDKRDLADRLIYSDVSEFLVAYKYNNGKLRKINKHQAFMTFHRLYKEMSEQTAYNKTEE